MKRTIKFGIFGLSRGAGYFKAVLGNGAEIVAACDKLDARRERAKREIGDSVTTYDNFDEFINHPGLEAIFLCNYFHQHTRYAVEALKRGIHVLSEVTSNATMAEGVALVRAARESRAIYMLAENYPYMKFNREMKRVYEGGSLGRCIYAEGEYNHPTAYDDEKSIRLYRPYEKHWRNFLPRTYYLTHSIGPLMHITGAMPKRVCAMGAFIPEVSDTLMGLMVGDKAAIITCINDDDSVYKFTGCAAFGAHGNSYRICGTKGQIENSREDNEKIILRYNAWDTPDGMDAISSYIPEEWDEDRELIEKAGHGGGDFFVIREFLDCIRENRQPFFDVYRSTAMASVAILAHRSALERGVPYDVPDFTNEDDLKKYENDTLTPFWSEDGEAPSVPCCTHPDYTPDEKEVERYHAILNKQ